MPEDFIRERVAADNASGKYSGRVVTRFPPEPNGYLHIGHAKSICLNFGVAAENNGTCHLRFDDTNPVKEDPHYVESIQNDVRWLGFDWGENLFHASDYFEQFYEYAVRLVQDGKAYVDASSEEQIRADRGTVTEPGRHSPDRNRPSAESLDLLQRMRAGEFADGTYVLRAKIDMANPNMKMRDPLIYRIRRVPHHRTGSTWNIYPMYDFAHCLSDSIERITHSLCTLEFENNRELYDWFLQQLPVPKPDPEQIEFARLNLSHTVMSKRLLLRLVQEQHVRGWDDPRLPTLSGLRRRGYTPSAIRAFCERIGVAKRDSVVDHALLEYYIREELNKSADRVMAVLRPLRVVIENYPEGEVEQVEAINNPEDPASASRSLPFGREIYIEQDDFREDPPSKYFRLSPGAEVRLKHAYFIRCERAVKDAAGNVVELRCTYDPATKSGTATDRKVKGTLHWVAAAHAADAEVRLYDHLFTNADPAADFVGDDFRAALNPKSLEVISGVKVEPGLGRAQAGMRYQFLRHGYFVVDPESTPDRVVFNRTVTLRDTWAKIEKAL
jgi:glutaminyl-tRNA synthetase